MKVRRPLKYALVVAGLAAGWAAGGALQGRHEPAPAPKRGEPRTRPTTVPTVEPTSRPSAEITLVPSPGIPGEGEKGAAERPALSRKRARYNHRPQFDKARAEGD